MNFRTEPPTAPLPPIVKQMAVSHVQHVRDCECCGQGHLTNACMSCGRIWPCDVSLLLTTLWGAQKIRTLWDSAMLPDEYQRWVALEGGGESEALGHPGATNGPGTTTDKGAPGTTPENGAQRAEEMVEAAAEAMHALEYPRWSATAHPDHNRWSWRGDGVSEAERDTYLGSGS